MSERRPRVLIGKPGLDGHDRGAKVTARALRDAGMEVVYLGRFGTPERIVDAALEEGVDVIGLSCHSWEYLYYLDELFERLTARGLELPVVVGGSVLSGDDKREIEAKGVAATFGPGTGADEIVTTATALLHRLTGASP